MVLERKSKSIKGKNKRINKGARNMRIFLWILTLFIFVFLQTSLIFGENGLLEYRLSEQKIQAIVKHNRSLMDENALLRGEVKDLKSGLQEIESEARTQLGMLKEGEEFIWIPKHN